MTESLIKVLDHLDGQKKEDGGAKNWWRWPLIIVLMLVGLAIGAYVINRDRKELAKLRHERNREEVRRGNALSMGLAEKELIKSKKALKDFVDASDKIDAIDDQIAKAEARYAKDKANIERLRWRDLPRNDQ